LLAERARSPLFDTARHARHLEDAYLHMHRAWQAREPPRHFAVPA
jgi:hypothetical protein